ncbi:MAG: hypothetical protein SNF33_08305 [Candidatus Algichlamydia australiensis]|nr:hypothetical protein [Chlamydiales bacterium]
MKSERLKKLESELNDLKNWLDLGLVPKKDEQKHQAEIDAIAKKIHEEKERLSYLKENGDQEEYTAPKRSKEARSTIDQPTISDVGGTTSDSSEESTETGVEMETSTGVAAETSTGWDESDETSEEKTIVEDDEDDPFSDKNRWRRGILADPESDSW